MKTTNPKITRVQVTLLETMNQSNVMIVLRQYMKTANFENKTFGKTYRNKKVSFPTAMSLLNNGYLEDDISVPYKNDRYRYLVLSDKGKTLLASVKNGDVLVKEPKKTEITEKQITEILKKNYSVDGWVFFSQLRGSTGARGNQQYIDGYAMNLWPYRNIEAISFEIKVSKSDFKKEISLPNKREYAKRISNQFYFVTQENLIPISEIPQDCGLIEIKGTECVVRKKAPFRIAQQPTWDVMRSLARQIYRTIQKEDDSKNIIPS